MLERNGNMGESGFRPDDLSTIAELIEMAGGREELIRISDDAIFLKGIQGRMKGLAASLVLSNPDFSWKDPLPDPNTIEGQKRLEELKTIFTNALGPVFNFPYSPDV